MPQQPPRRPGTKPTPPGVGRSGTRRESNVPEDESDRPTVNPPFDVEAFARASAASPVPRGPTAPRQWPPEPPTVRPPLPDGTVPQPRAEQITLTNEVELEEARARSAVPMGPEAESRRSGPPRHGTPAPPLVQSARTPSVPGAPSGPRIPSVLSMANARAPSVPEMPAARRPSASNIEAAVLGAISNAGPDIVERTIEDPIAEMRERFSLGDYTGALEIAELMLAEDPHDAEAGQCAESCRGVLESMYAARLGSLDRVPTVLVQPAQLRW